ncbi:hypothetical protein HOL24_02670 [bacterium]|jgi:hypothetical protein|nr:hypothetical protein [bacterium]
MKNGRYLELVDHYYPRVIGSIDRDISSPTLGSCDRNYWMYKIHDFNSGIIQQSSLTFALLSLIPDCEFKKSCNYLNKEKKEYWRWLSKKINTYTLSLYRGGYLDEYYPNEKSFPATCFTSYAVLKSALILGQFDIVDSDVWPKVVDNIMKKPVSDAANQDIAACAYLWLYYKNIDSNRSDILSKIDELVKREVFKGKMNEYGGFDFGYASVTLNYLSYMYDDGCTKYLNLILSLSKTLSSFIPLSGVIAGEMFSRNTSYFLPYGILVGATMDEESSHNLYRLSCNDVFQKLDDRYLLHYTFPSLVRSALFVFNDFENNLLDINTDKNNSLVDANELVTMQIDDTLIIITLLKGGSIAILNNDCNIYDNGYRIIDKNLIAASNLIGESKLLTKTTDSGVIHYKIESRFGSYKIIQPSIIKTIAIRLMSLFGRHLNKLFKYLLITNPTLIDNVSLIRSITIDSNMKTVRIVDCINSEKKLKIMESPVSSFRLVPSAKFYQLDEEYFYGKDINMSYDGSKYTREKIFKI